MIQSPDLKSVETVCSSHSWNLSHPRSGPEGLRSQSRGGGCGAREGGQSGSGLGLGSQSPAAPVSTPAFSACAAGCCDSPQHLLFLSLECFPHRQPACCPLRASASVLLSNEASLLPRTGSPSAPVSSSLRHHVLPLTHHIFPLFDCL